MTELTHSNISQCGSDLIHFQSATDTGPAQLVQNTLQILRFHTFNNVYIGTNQCFASVYAAKQ